MKKRSILLLTVLMCIALSGCGKTTSKDDTGAMEKGNFLPVPEMEGVVYSKETKVMYYMISTSEASGQLGYGYGYFGPYINENGKYCRYMNGVEEIDAP